MQPEEHATPQPPQSPSQPQQASEAGHAPRKSRRGIWWFLLIPVLLAVFGLMTFLARGHTTKSLAATTQSLVPEAVSLTHPQPGKPDDDLALPSTLQAYDQSPVYARTSGYVSHWYVDLGAHVRKGQLLAVIASPEVDQQLAQSRAFLSQTQANLSLAQVTAQRYQELIGTNAVAQQQVDQNNQSLNAQKAALAASQADVRRLEELQGFEQVSAPFDGIITQRLTDTGNLINAGNSGANTQLFSVSKSNVVRVFVPVPEIYSSQITNGLRASLDLVQLPHQKFSGAVTRSSRAIDLASHTLLTEIDVPNPGGQLLPGAYATVHLHLANKVQPLTVPIGAVLFQAAGPQVAVVAGNDPKNTHVELHKVTIGRDFGSTIEITGGLTANDSIVAAPPDYLIDGMQVTVQTPTGQQAASETKS